MRVEELEGGDEPSRGERGKVPWGEQGHHLAVRHAGEAAQPPRRALIMCPYHHEVVDPVQGLPHPRRPSRACRRSG